MTRVLRAGLVAGALAAVVPLAACSGSATGPASPAAEAGGSGERA